MPRHRKEPPLQVGSGLLRYPGFRGEVAYEVAGSPERLRPEGQALRGALTASTEEAEAAFRACRGHLQLEDGREYQITLIGYTKGSPTAYFELRL